MACYRVEVKAPAREVYIVDADNPEWAFNHRSIFEMAEQIASSLPRQGLPNGELRMAVSNWWLHRGNWRHHNGSRIGRNGKRYPVTGYPFGPNCTKCLRTSARLVGAWEEQEKGDTND